MEVTAMGANAATISIRQAAAELGVHENTVRNWIDRGYLRAYRLPSGHRRLPEAEVTRLMGELFAVPTSIEEDRPTAAPKARESEPVFEGRLPE
jgi:excisionase family DNA binding protein